MEEILRKTLLYDFYGELLTPHQQEIFEEVVLNDTSFSEVAAREGVSRQSIHELVRKCEKQLEYYESCLHMMERFLKLRDLVKAVQEKAQILEKDSGGKDILTLCEQIMEEL